MIKKNYKKALSFAIGLILIIGGSYSLADELDDVGGETEASSPSEKQIFKGEASDRGNHVYQFEFLRGHFGMYVPKLANEQDIANVMRKYVPENKSNKARKQESRKGWNYLYKLFYIILELHFDFLSGYKV